MFLGSTPAPWAKLKSFLIRLSLSTFAIAKSLSCESTHNVNDAWSGATLISAFPVTEMMRGWLKLSCAKSEGISVVQSAKTTAAWTNFPFIGEGLLGENTKHAYGIAHRRLRESKGGTCF